VIDGGPAGGDERPLSPIVGSQLSSVEFVQDYVQLRFDGPTLTAFTVPSIITEHGRYEWETPGYRDALCSLIGKLVRSTSVCTDQVIRIEFEDASAVEVSLRPADYRGPEAAMFTNGPGETWVW
jgi:hypothetical protein